MIRTGDLVSKKEKTQFGDENLLIVYDDMGESSQYCYVLPIDLDYKEKRPVRILKTELQTI